MLRHIHILNVNKKNTTVNYWWRFSGNFRIFFNCFCFYNSFFIKCQCDSRIKAYRIQGKRRKRTLKLYFQFSWKKVQEKYTAYKTSLYKNELLKFSCCFSFFFLHSWKGKEKKYNECCRENRRVNFLLLLLWIMN